MRVAVAVTVAVVRVARGARLLLRWGAVTVTVITVTMAVIAMTVPMIVIRGGRHRAQG